MFLTKLHSDKPSPAIVAATATVPSPFICALLLLASTFSGCSEIPPTSEAVDQLKFTLKPLSYAQSCALLPLQPTVSATSASGSIDTTYDKPITLTAHSDPGCTVNAPGTLSATTNPATAIEGTAAFSGLKYMGNGVIYLKATSNDQQTSVCSEAITVSGTASSLQFVAQPTSVTAGVAHATQPFVQEIDQCGLTNTTSTSTITLRISEDSSCNTFSSGTIAAASNPLNLSSGRAQFSNVTLSKAGTMYIKAESATHSACSSAITVSSNEANGTILSFVQLPRKVQVNANFTPQVTVAITDAQGNIIAAESDTITLDAFTDSSCSVAATGTLSLASNGVATANAIASFNQVRYNRHETLYLKASSATHGTKCSSAISVSGLPAIIGGFTAFTGFVNPTGSIYTFGSNYVSGVDIERGIPTRMKNLSGVIQADGGITFFCAVKTDATVWCLGVGTNGQLGNSGLASSAVPVQVTGMTNAVMVAAGSTSACAIKTDGTVWCWGQNAAGILALGTGAATGNYNTPQQVPGITNAAGIYGGPYHYCITLRDSTVKCWGFGTSGQLGNGASATSGTPVNVLTLHDVQSMSIGSGFTYATLSNGTVFSWGSDTNGELGTANASGSSNVPVPITELGAIQSIATGKSASYLNAFASKSDGTVWGWGRNATTTIVLGDKNLSNQLVPFQLTGLSDVVAMAAWYIDTAVQYADGAIRSWGRNEAGSLGYGTSGPGVGGLVNVLSLDGDSTITGIHGGASGGVTSSVCTTHSDNTAKCWGILADLTTASTWVNTPTTLNITGVDSVSLAVNAACAHKTDNTLRCWGTGTGGQLGGGVTANSLTTPVDPGLTNMIQVSTSSPFACGVRSDGTVWCWGKNDYNVMGNSTIALAAIRNSPIQVDGITDAKAVATNENSVCVIVDNGVAADSVKCWGRDNNGNLGNGGAIAEANTAAAVDVTGLTDVTHITGGVRHFCARKTDSTVWCWGDNAFGQLGDNSITDRSSPVQMTGVTTASKVYAGGYYTIALLADGTATIVGPNTTGRMMSSTDAAQTTDHRVARTILGLNNISEVATSNSHACFLLNNSGTKSVKCLGLYNKHTLGISPNGLLIPYTAVTNYMHTPRRYGSGDGFSCRIEFDGRVRCWGKNSSGQLGNGNTTNSNTPVYVSNIGGGVAGTDMIAVGKEHACALLADGKVYCWGENGTGQLGNNSTTDSSTPVEISTISGTVIDLVAGNNHTCAGMEGATFNVRCWGDNTYGQLGDASFVQALTPAATSVGNTTLTSTFWDYLVAGGDHTCLMLQDRTMRCWGRNDLRQLADGSTTNRNTSVKMGNGTSHPIEPYYYAGGSGTSQHNCGVVMDSSGKVQCWGDNTYGQLGNGTNVAETNPVYVSGITNAISVEVGKEHSCATKNDGTVYCWGRNNASQLGNGGTANSNVPVQVSGITNGSYHLALGADHSCVTLRTGAVMCWGDNTSGQLGNGSNTTSATPVAAGL